MELTPRSVSRLVQNKSLITYGFEKTLGATSVIASAHLVSLLYPKKTIRRILVSSCLDDAESLRLEGKPEWNQHWFSLTCGPRLVKQGKIWLSPLSEGFRDPHVLNVAGRTAIGFPANRQQLFLITFLASLSLQQEAEIMKAIGCVEAMNLDGGASEALAYKGEILLPPGRNLTNAIVVYDRNHPAPAALKTAWGRFHARRSLQLS